MPSFTLAIVAGDRVPFGYERLPSVVPDSMEYATMNGGNNIVDVRRLFQAVARDGGLGPSWGGALASRWHALTR